MDAKILALTSKDTESRTTCTLTTEGIAALQSLTEEFGLTQKAVLGFLIKDGEVNADVLKVAKVVDISTLHRGVRKSLIATKKTLKALNDASKVSGISRDIIIDFGVRFLAAVLQQARQETMEKHKAALVVLDDLAGKMDAVENQLKDILDEEDPILSRFSTVIVVMENLLAEINNEIKSGQPINADF